MTTTIKHSYKLLTKDVKPIHTLISLQQLYNQLKIYFTLNIFYSLFNHYDNSVMNSFNVQLSILAIHSYNAFYNLY